MINRYYKTIWLVVVAFVIFAGCVKQQQKQQKEDFSPYIPAYITTAVEKAGGLDAWTRTKRLEFDCVATFYQPDGSFYITQQHHEIYPWLNLIRISAKEPQSKFIWEFSSGVLSAIEGTKQENFLPAVLGAEDFAEALLNITTTPVQLFKGKDGFMRSPRPVKLQGRWYYPIDKVRPDKTSSELHWPIQVFYQNRDNSLVDMLWFKSVDGGTFLAVRGYDYHEVEKGGVVAPAKIEIFTTNERSIIRHRLVKIDYY